MVSAGVCSICSYVWFEPVSVCVCVQAHECTLQLRINGRIATSSQC